ncbi:MAG: peptidoglycan-binding domain-containing protein [Actinomycetes bacterium]
MPRPLTPLAVLAAAVLLFGAASCSSSDSSTTTTTEPATTTTVDEAAIEATVRFDKEIQSQLAAVGCYSGNIDGIIGPATDAAIVAFQQASGLVADGELGPETENALNKAVASRSTVCGSASTTTSSKPATTTTFAPNGAPCTATAIVDGLGGDPSTTLTNYVCSGGYAAGTVTGGSKFILQAQSGKWVQPAQSPCGTASAGLPPIILEDGC